MELAQGGTALNMVRKQGSFFLREACDITIQAARGLEAAHNHGLVHRDVKPENLILVGAMIRDLESLAQSTPDADPLDTTVAPRVLIVESCWQTRHQRTDLAAIGR